MKSRFASRDSYPDWRRTSPAFLGTAGVLSLGAFLILIIFTSDRSIEYSAGMISAAETMENVVKTAREFCDSAGITIDETIDPNRTCFIGPELTELMTTLGHVDAKRTSTDPVMASLIAYMLAQVGVERGDTIAIGSSASFPALLFASLAAAEALDIHAVVIVSLGASTYGATDPNFHLLDMYSLMLRSGLIRTPPAAVTLGGGKDIGEDFDSAFSVALIDEIEEAGLPFIYDGDLRSNVAKRMTIYGDPPHSARISAFINTGGSYANMGNSALALKLDPGVNFDVELPREEERGVLFEMAERDIPVIHLLFLRGISREYGLLWDPIPLRKPGEMPIMHQRASMGMVLWLVGIPYLVLVSLLTAGATSKRSSPPR